jgi:hypothetical protein
MAGCNCNMGLSNTGRPNCVPIQSVTSKLIMVPLSNSDGELNFIDLTSPLPNFTELVNSQDESFRWFPLPVFENVELPKADSKFEEANSGRMVFLRQGKRSFSGELWADDSSPTLLSKLQNNRCVEFGVYIVDINGNLIGSKVGDALYPIKIDNASFDPKLMFATDSTTQKIMVAFDFDRLFDEGTLYMITPTEAIDFNTLEGLIDVNFIDLEQDSASVVLFSLVLDYGTAINPILFKGGQLADFQVYNINGDFYEDIDYVDENPANPGFYELGLDGATFNSGTNYIIKVIRDGYTGSVTFEGND